MNGRHQASPREPANVRAASWTAKCQSPILIGLLLGVITVILYWPVVGFEFVNYDDSDYVTANVRIQGGFKTANIAWAFTTGHASNWHPLTWLSHMLDWRLFGSRAGGHHFMSLLFHVANTILLFVVSWKMTRGFWFAAMVAGFFAWHPLHVESVAWVSERKDVLSGFFFLLTLLAYVKYVEAVAGSSRKNVRLLWYGLTFLSFGCGLMSKPMLVTLPFVLLLLDYWPLQRVQFTDLKAFSRVALEKAPLFILAAASSVVTFLVQKQGGAVSTSISVGARVPNALVSYMRYLGKMFWPENLSVLYPHPGHWPLWQVIFCAAGLLLISGLVVILAPRRPWLTVGWFWFVGMLVPVIGLVQVGIQSMADRYMYLPMIGLLFIVGWEGRLLVLGQIPGQVRLVLMVVIVGALLGCAWTTSLQLEHWRNSENLFRRAVRVTSKNYLAYNNLGYHLSGKGKIGEAIECYQRALEIEPNYEDARNNLGYALAGQRRFAEAIEQYQIALRTRPNHVEVHNNLGNALSELGRIDEAMAHYAIVLKQKPDHADANNNLGIALAMRGRLAEAIPHFEKAIRAKPGYASAHSNLGNALAVQRKFDEAANQYLEALRLKPDDAQAHNNLANVLTEQGKLEEAVTHYTQALRLNPDNPEAYHNLGVTLVRQNKPEEAKRQFTEALRLKPDYQEARRQLELLSKPR